MTHLYLWLPFPPCHRWPLFLRIPFVEVIYCCTLGMFHLCHVVSFACTLWAECMQHVLLLAICLIPQSLMSSFVGNNDNDIDEDDIYIYFFISINSVSWRRLRCAWKVQKKLVKGLRVEIVCQITILLGSAFNFLSVSLSGEFIVTTL